MSEMASGLDETRSAEHPSRNPSRIRPAPVPQGVSGTKRNRHLACREALQVPVKSQEVSLRLKRIELLRPCGH